jgi:hypothetical protein
MKNTEIEHINSKYQKVNKRKPRNCEIHAENSRYTQKKRGKTCDEEKLRWRRGEASAAMRERVCFNLEQ